MTEFIAHLLVVAMAGGAVAKTTEFKHFLASGKAFFGVFHLIDSKDWREFLAGEGFIFADFVAVSRDDLGALWNGEASVLGDVGGRHTGNRGVEFGVGFFATAFGDAEHEFFEHALFVFAGEIDAIFLKQVDDLVINGGIDEDGRLGSADHAVIEGLRKIDVVDRFFKVSGFVDIARNVTRTDAKGWFARSVSGVDHAWTTGRKDGGNAWVLH